MNSKKTRNSQDKFTHATSLFNKGLFRESAKILESLQPRSNHSHEVNSYLADCYRNLGEFNRAVPVYNKLLNLNVNNHKAKTNLFICLKNSLPNKYTIDAENDALTYLLFEGVNHNDLSAYICELLVLKYDLVNGSKQIELQDVAKDHLLKLTLHKLIIANEYLEMFLTGIRSTLLHTMMESTQVSIQDVDLAIAISMQQFLSEYTFIDTEVEQQSVSHLIIFLEKITTDSSTPIDSLLAPLILISMYCPLNNLGASETLSNVPLEHWPEIVRGLVSQQILFPRKEMQYLPQISQLKTIENSVSTRVQEQYEQNPYPRWLSANFNLSDNYAKDVSNILGDYTPAKPLKTNRLEILVAGCGTGKQVVELARSYPSASILAVDLSKRSIAYAMLKTEEYSLTNVDFLQADILDLASLNKTFDVIESIGVLHHMEDPKQGWNVLSQLLAPHGIMKIGLYSKLARAPITQARKMIAENNIETSNQAIRLFRKEAMMGSYGEAIRELACHSIDFYSMSACRDLFFHVQEHQFDCLEIDQILKELNMEFLGFCQTNTDIAREYQHLSPQCKSMKSLNIWADAEKKYPKAFGQMYQFWCQKAST